MGERPMMPKTRCARRSFVFGMPQVGICTNLLLFLQYAMGTHSLLAAPLDPRTVCGTPNEEVSQEIKGNLEGKAQTFARIGTAELQGAASKTRHEIEVRETRSDAARELHYLNYISCVIIYQDDHLSTDDKLRRINVLRDAFKPATGAGPSGRSEDQAPNIASTWLDNWGTNYEVVQEGNTFRFSASGISCMGNPFKSTGRGTIIRYNVETTYTSTIPSGGRCTGTVSDAQMNLTCRDTRCGSFTSSLFRQE